MVAAVDGGIDSGNAAAVAAAGATTLIAGSAAAQLVDIDDIQQYNPDGTPASPYDGQLVTVLRDRLGVDPVSMTKVSGQPFLIRELVERIQALKSEAAA